MKDLIQHYYDTFNSGDREELLEMLADDVVHEINEGTPEVGRESFRVFLNRMDRCYQEQVEDLVVFSSETQNRAAAEFYIRGKYIGSDEGLPEATGQTYHLRIGAFFEVINGQITRITNYYNLTEWLRMISA